MGYCHAPLKGFYIGSKYNGKRNFKVTSQAVDHLEMINGVWQPVFDSDLPVKPSKELREKGVSRRPYITKYIEIPCGQCIGCRLQRSREWANRMMMELETTNGPASFITLTYDDEHLPMTEGINRITGEYQEFGNLVLEDLQKFIKRLRKRFSSSKIRYFACGEYGEKSQRPHFHLIVFGWFPDDAKFLRKGRAGEYNYYESEILNELWPFGLHVVSDVTWESCAYTARYVVKKFTGPESVRYEEKHVKPPFVIMSNKPGLGHDYYLRHYEMFDDDVKLYYLKTDKGSISFSKPRYFKKLDELEEYKGYIDIGHFLDIANLNHTETFDIVNSQEEERKVIELSTDLDYFEELAVQGKYKEQQTQILKRGMI